ncbi:hypothetical protein A0H81_13111 [Grifola frondosa]|uniref:Uncharacterized protein n=1 Tax=Grifola frondosa TaxID=5627 RepID=A0A1C7LRW3_GRIFR|nr:hypothetical protein A0H81_13111 [Grifola frondosa]
MRNLSETVLEIHLPAMQHPLLLPKMFPLREDTLDESPLIPGAEDIEGEDEDEELQRRLGDLDLESASYDEMWAALTPLERDKFLRALSDPSSELAQELLASEDLEKGRIEPWWEAPSELPQDQVSDSQNISLQLRIRRRYGTKPAIMSIPTSMVQAASASILARPPLLYNLSALCIAYAYVSRYFAVSPLASLPAGEPEIVEACRILSNLVPFLVDRKSNIVHSSLSSVITDLWSRFQPGQMTSTFFSALLRDAATLLKPSSVTLVSPSTPSVTLSTSDVEGQSEHCPDLENHSSANTLRVLTDLSSLFQQSSRSGPAPFQLSPPSQSSKPRPNHIAHKLTFYAAQVVGTPSPLLRALADEVAVRAEKMKFESQATHEEVQKRPVVDGVRTKAKVRIEELT